MAATGHTPPAGQARGQRVGPTAWGAFGVGQAMVMVTARGAMMMKDHLEGERERLGDDARQVFEWPTPKRPQGSCAPRCR